METVIVAIRPHEHSSVTSEFNPAAYDILLTDVKLANSDKTKGFKQLPKTTVSYDQEPAEALCSFLFALTGHEHGGLKGKRAIFIPPTRGEAVVDSHQDPYVKGTLYCIPVDSRERLNPKVSENTPSTPGFYSLNLVLDSLNSNAYAYTQPTRIMLHRLESWLQAKSMVQGAVGLLFSMATEHRLKLAVSNPAFYTENFSKHGQRLESTSDIYSRSIANEALAKMMAIEKCDITIINPLFGTGLPYKNKVEAHAINRYWGMGKPDYKKIGLPPSSKTNVKSKFTITEESTVEDNDNNSSSCTRKCKSKSNTSSKNSCTISIIDQDTWAPLEGMGHTQQNRPLTAAMVVDEFIERTLRGDKDSKELANLQESKSVVVSSATIVEDLTAAVRPSHSSSNTGEYPLHKCAYEGNAEKLRELLREGQEVSQKDKDSWTCLHYAAWFGHVNAVIVLLNEGKASPTITNDNGSTPLHLAAVNGYHYVVELLLNHPETDIGILDKDNKTALDQCEGIDTPECRSCIQLLKRAAERPSPKIQVFLMDGTHRMLTLVSGADTTVHQIHQQMMRELELPESCGSLFTIWICSRNLQLQLKRDHKPIQHLNDWRRKIVEMLTDEDPFNEYPQLFWRRDAILSISAERKVKHGQAINLLFHEAYHNYIKSLYPCADKDAILLGGILMQLSQGDYDQRKIKNFFSNERTLQTLVPVAKLRNKTMNWATRIQTQYRIFSVAQVNEDRSPQVLQQRFLTLCWNLRVYGSAFFTGYVHVKSKSKATVYIGVNDIGVHIIHGQNKSMLRSCCYEEITWEGKNKCILELRMKTSGKGVMSIFTRQAGLIHHLMSKLVQINHTERS